MSICSERRGRTLPWTVCTRPEDVPKRASDSIITYGDRETRSAGKGLEIAADRDPLMETAQKRQVEVIHSLALR